MGEVGISVLLDGNLIQASGIARFTFVPTGREYLLYSLNEKIVKDGVELNKIYVSEIGEGTSQLSMISQDDWVSIQNIMSELSKPGANVPNNIQLGQLTPKQYIVGPYKKIAVKDELKNGIVATQMANQPKETNDLPMPVNQQFLGPQDNSTETKQVAETVVPDAFGMSAPVPEQTAPIALVTEEVPTVVQSVVPQPGEVPAIPTPEVPVQPQVVEQVVAPAPVETPAPIESDINQSVKNVINYINGDVNKLSELFKTNGLDITVTQNVTKQVAETPVEQTPVNTIDITNLPIASQPISLPKEVLNEESIEPSTPALPVDEMEPVQSAPVSSITQDFVVQQPTQPVVVPTEAQPVVVAEPTIPVSQPTQIVQPVVQEPTIVQKTTVPVQQVVSEPEMVNTTLVTTTATQPINLTASQLTQEAQNSNVEFNIPEEVEAPVEAAPQEQIPVVQSVVVPTSPVGTAPVVAQPVEAQPVNPTVPTIIPITEADIQPQSPTQQVIQDNQSTNIENDKSFLAAAGPVVMPIGQEGVTASGSPGDSGQM